ncbi:major facilitator superfamily transporter [Mycena latifolia]|nr:major facilitator superfamily transporter [Mycena latifolia]
MTPRPTIRQIADSCIFLRPSMPEASTALSGSAIELERRPGTSNNSETQLAPSPEVQVPDGGYGWVVVFGCAILTWWFVGTTYSWGLIQAALVKQGLSSASTLSFVGSSTVACISGLALVNARVIRFLGAQKTALLGISLIGIGEILSGFATLNIGALFLTTGAITGIGTSLCFMVVSVTPAQYFNKKRGLANGIVYAGGGLGGAVTSFGIDGLIQHLGPAWTFRILGLITLATGLPAAWLIKERTSIRTTGFIDWSLFRDLRFIVLFFAGALGTFPLFVPPFFLPLYSASLGLPASAGAGLVAGFNFSSALGRLGCGFASDLIGPVNVLFLALLLSAVSMLAIWPVSTSLTPLALFVVVNGAANGGFFSTMPTVVGTVFGSARVSVAMGMIVTGWVGGYLMGAPIAGYLLNAYGGAQSTLSAYHPAMFYAGSMAMGAAGLVSLVRLKTSTSIFAKV